MKGLSFSEEVLGWVTQALRNSHQDEKKFHDEAIARLQREHRRIQDRIDAGFFDRKTAEFRLRRCRLMRDIDAHQVANKNYIEEGIKVLGLAQQAHRLFESQPPSEKWKLLDFGLSNCRWKDGHLDADYRRPFDLIAAAAVADGQLNSGGAPETGDFGNWRRERDSNPR